MKPPPSGVNCTGPTLVQPLALLMSMLYCACRSRMPCAVTYQSYWNTTWYWPGVGTSNSAPCVYCGAAVFQPFPTPVPHDALDLVQAGPRTRQELELKALFGSVLPSVDVMS